MAVVLKIIEPEQKNDMHSYISHWWVSTISDGQYWRNYPNKKFDTLGDRQNALLYPLVHSLAGDNKICIKNSEARTSKNFD